MHKLFISLLVTMFALAAPAFSQEHTKLARDIVSVHIVQSYQVLSARSKTLHAVVRDTCSGGGRLASQKPQQAFKDVLSAWMAVQHIRFGPALVQDRFYRFQFWPDKHGQAAKQIRRRLSGPIDKIPDSAQISTVSVALQGLPALERILFRSKPMTTEQRTKACKLAMAIGFNLESIASIALKEWGSYEPQNDKMLLDAVVRGLIEQLQIIANLKLVRPLGKSLEGARPRRAESWRSQMSLLNIKSNLEGLRDLLQGDEAHPGLASVLLNEGETLGVKDAIINQINFGIDRIDALPLTLHDAVTDPEARKEVVSLVAQLEGIRELVLDQLVPALGLNMGFNTQDGD